MNGDRGDDAAASMPSVARWLGLAGLLPQVAVVAVLLSHSPQYYYTALSLGYAYAALILSFLGGIWWGLAARGGDEVPGWIWVVAVLPSLVALASAIPWAIGMEWPRPSLGWIGLCLIGSFEVDRRLLKAGLAPRWWMTLRLPLSIGLGLLTLAAACV